LLSFFENLGYQKKALSYALAMDLWEPEQDIPIVFGTVFLDVESVYKHIEQNIISEFGDEVLCERKKAVFLLLNGQTEIEREGILFRRKTKDGFDYAALYTIVFPLSIKRFTVQIYTLYLLQGKDAATEGQQALSLKQNSDPIRARKTKTMRDIILAAINESANAIDIYGSEDTFSPQI
jgi:hypothetical protein